LCLLASGVSRAYSLRLGKRRKSLISLVGTVSETDGQQPGALIWF
jgi:hypothetical protein